MRLSARLSYPGVGPEQVFAMLTDPDFLAQVCTATGALSHTVAVAGGVITTTRVLPTDQVPDAVRSLVGDRLTVRRVDRWQATPPQQPGRREGSIEVVIEGTPVTLRGTLLLTGDAQGTEQLVDGDLNAAIPLLGGRIAKAAEPAVRAAIEVEQRVGRAWLAR